jgi:hypothetical protein
MGRTIWWKRYLTQLQEYLTHLIFPAFLQELYACSIQILQFVIGLVSFVPVWISRTFRDLNFSQSFPKVFMQSFAGSLNLFQCRGYTPTSYLGIFILSSVRSDSVKVCLIRRGFF